MPAYTDHEGNRIRFAGKDEVRAFANRVREAGGAKVLAELLPSQPSNSEECLIANALNFGCKIAPFGEREYADGTYVWLMRVGGGDEFIRKLADKLGMRTARHIDGDPVADSSLSWLCGKPELGLRLPKRIGAAAQAFDHGVPEFDELVR